MVALPAIEFLGLKGTAAYIALGVATAGTVAVVSKAAPAILGSSGAASHSAPSAGASPTDILNAVAKGSAATAAGLGYGAQLGEAGLGVGRDLGYASLGLAGNVTRVAGDIAQQLSAALVATNRSLIDRLPASAPAPAPVTGPSVGGGGSTIRPLPVVNTGPSTSLIGQTGAQLAAAGVSGYTQVSPTEVRVTTGLGASSPGVTGSISPTNVLKGYVDPKTGNLITNVSTPPPGAIAVYA